MQASTRCACLELCSNLSPQYLQGAENRGSGIIDSHGALDLALPLGVANGDSDPVGLGFPSRILRGRFVAV